MMFNKRFIVLASAFILFNSVYANQDSICPDINQIKAKGINVAERIAVNKFFSYSIDNYNTNTSWAFGMAPITAKSTERALDKANEILSTMSTQGRPKESHGELVCLYQTGHSDILAAAIKADHPNSLEQYFQNSQ